MTSLGANDDARGLPSRLDLLVDLMREAPYQPATNYWRAVEILEVLRRGLPQGRGLDLGCGDGHLMAILLAHAGPRDMVGLDVDTQELRMAEQRKVYSAISRAHDDGFALAAEQFDFVFSNSVLEHIASIDAVLAEVARVLRPDGRLIFTVPGPDFHACLRGSRWRSRDDYLRNVDQRCLHLRYWDLATWAAHLARAGFEIVYQGAYLSDAQVQRWERLAAWTSGMVFQLGGGRLRPIELQRLAKVRRVGLRLPRWLAAVVAGGMDAGARRPAKICGCLLVEARLKEGERRRE